MSSSHPSSQTRVTRPAPPLQRVPGGGNAHHHHHHHAFPFFFATAPIFFGSSFAYPYGFNYGYGSPYGFGWPYGLGSPYPFGAPYGSAMPYGLAEPGFAPAPIYAPFYCSLDGLAFQDEAMFVRHLHDAHGVPSENALSYAESIGGSYVFFGF
jgi:hypothetical protein